MKVPISLVHAKTISAGLIEFSTLILFPGAYCRPPNKRKEFHFFFFVFLKLIINCWYSNTLTLLDDSFEQSKTMLTSNE